MISLTHIKDEETRNKIRGLIRFLESMPDIELLRWAFDLDTWMPKPVENVFRYDNAFTVGADLGIAIYLTGDGSDGRGDEVGSRVRSGRPMIAFRAEGVRPNKYVDDMLKHFEYPPVQSFTTFVDLESQIRKALKEVSNSEQLVLFEQSVAAA
jgi:hypothetical protein